MDAAAGKKSPEANKTVPTPVDPHDFINTVDISAVRREDARVLVELMQEITGQAPRMWGPSIIGFGEYHYKYASGREGDAAAVGFSPRKASLVLYLIPNEPAAAPLLAKLGKFKSSVACVYINKLADIDLAVLRELIALSYQYTTTHDIPSLQSQRP